MSWNRILHCHSHRLQKEWINKVNFPGQKPATDNRNRFELRRARAHIIFKTATQLPLRTHGSHTSVSDYNNRNACDRPNTGNKTLLTTIDLSIAISFRECT